MGTRIDASVVRLLPALAAICASVYGQTFYGSIVGAITDASGAPVANAAVVVTNVGTTFSKLLTNVESIDTWLEADAPGSGLH